MLTSQRIGIRPGREGGSSQILILGASRTLGIMEQKYVSFDRRLRNFHCPLCSVLSILVVLNVLCVMQTVAFVEVRPFHGCRFYGKKVWSSDACTREKVASLYETIGSDLQPNKGTSMNTGNHQRYQRYQRIPDFQRIAATLDKKQSLVEINDWISTKVHNQWQGGQNATTSWALWSVREQVQFIKYLQQRRAYTSILSFLAVLDFDRSSEEPCDTGQTWDHHKCDKNVRDENLLVKVYTTALFAISSSLDTDLDETNNKLDTKAMATQILYQMDRNGVPATTLTYVAIFKTLQGRPGDVTRMIRFLDNRERNLSKDDGTLWNPEFYNAAISACRSRFPYSHQEKSGAGRRKISDRNSNKDWQTALNLMQQMQRKGIQPTSKTYLAVLDVLAQTRGKVPMIRSIVQQWKSSNEAGFCDSTEEDRIWATALNACAVEGDFCQALKFIEEMSGMCTPNLRHCTALLKALSGAKELDQGQLAMIALDAMMGNETALLKIHYGKVEHRVLLPPTDLDIVALNTILSIIVKAGNFGEAQNLFDRIQSGEFSDSNGTILFPDRITYHNLLAGSNDPEIAIRMVKGMRLSRRNRHGAIPPNSVTYAHAVSVCQRAKTPDMKTVNQLMKWAKIDQVKHTVFMYASAIWTAQRCGDLPRCLELYDEMERTECIANAVVMNGLLTALCDNGMHTRAMQVFNDLKDRGFHVSPIALKRLVFLTTQSKKTQFSNEEKEEILMKILCRLDPEERQVKVSSPVFEALISVNGSKGDIDQVLDVVDQINGCLDAACLRAILLAYSTSSKTRWWEAVELLHTTIIEESPAPGKVDQIALSHVVTTCSRANEFEEGLSLLNLYGIPLHELPTGFSHISVVALNALIAACGRGFRPDLSLSLLNEISSRYGLRPDSRSYRSAVIACNKAQHAEKACNELSQNALNENEYKDDDYAEPPMQWWECSLALYRRMTEEGLRPDVQTHSSIISSCEAAGQWQRALWVLQSIIDKSSAEPIDCAPSLNVYCWNAALSACEKGGAWVEALDLYERMLESSFKPNFVTMNSLIEALDKAGQKDLAQSIYDEGLERGILHPWKETTNEEGKRITALDLHKFSESMAKAAIRKTMDSWLYEKDTMGSFSGDFVIITGKGKHSLSHPVLQKATKKVLLDYGIEADVDQCNRGRIVVYMSDLMECYSAKSWR